MSFKIVSIGDYMTGENMHHYGRGIPRKFQDRFHDLVTEPVRETLSDGDILILNFESSLEEAQILDSLPIENAVYVAPLETFKLLNSLEIPIVANIANNHFGQHGNKRSQFTIQNLERNGIVVVGKNNLPVEIILKKYTLKIWGVSLVADENYDGAYFKSSYDSLLQDLKPLTAKGENEFHIISIHWGVEYSTLNNDKQTILARKLSEAGMDLVLGHHPHTIQPVEKINSTWVIYSHGNFLFDQNFSALTQTGLITKIKLPENQAEFYLSQQKDFQVVELNGASEDEIETFCKANFSVKKSLQMRILMKLEMLKNFNELNYPVIKTFIARLFRSRQTSNAKQI